ncbi:hypothetical protein B0H34DRAFT_444578 [Crassisporium funariophilum]|nr:hypothetical protein B0H34DRAFT_444578 [Crassisporium funariophilum]
MSVEHHPTPALPGYSPSLPSPSYSTELACGEQRLDHTPRSRRLAPTSLFIKKSGKTTIVLNEQEDGVAVPSYGRHAVINGTLFLEDPESVLKVVLTVEAKMDSAISEAGSRSILLIKNPYTLWSHEESQNPCAGLVPFSFVLPSTFKDGSNVVPLPPSYHFYNQLVSSLFVKSTYQLHFAITRIRHRKLEIWPKTKQIFVPFTYVPRTRSHRPIVNSPCFFSSVKTSPEEWYQAVTLLKTKANVKMDPINCHLFVPAGRIYGLTDTIPFHVQLSGVTCSLREHFGTPLLDRVASVDSQITMPFSKLHNPKPLLRVYILRQVSVSVKGESAWKNSIIGEGTIWPIPPDLSSCCESTSTQCVEGHVDWEGEVRCSEEYTVGGFHAANVHVKDFITLALSPPTPQSPLLELQISVPIRLVTDSFTDTADLDAPAV